MAKSPLGSISKGHDFLNWFYVGLNIENILYGIELFLYFKTIHIILRNRRKVYQKRRLFYALLSSMMLLLVTIWIATQAVFGQKMWLIDTSFPGGPNAYWRKNVADWYIDWGTTAIIILQLMTDALMIYRCGMIWNEYRIVIVPVILWFVTLLFGVSVDWTTSLPGGDYFTGISVRLSVTYWSLSVFLTTTLSCTICYRVVRHGVKVQEYLGREYASLHFAVVAVIVESVLPLTLSGIAMLISLGVGSPTSVTFVSVYFLMMCDMLWCISPQMLILRVMVGKAWGNDTFSESPSILEFSPSGGDATGSPLFDNSSSAAFHVRALSQVYHPYGRAKDSALGTPESQI